MGILRFFSTIRQFHYTKDCVEIINKPMNVKYFFIDFNSLIHPSKDKVLNDLNNEFEHILIKNNLTDFDQIKYEQQQLLKNINIKIQHATMTKVQKIIKTAIVKLDTLYIAIDGTPSVAKMLEQKKRRFMGKLFEYIELELIEKYKKELQRQSTKLKYNNRYLFEKYKIRWSSSHISPGTKFMIEFGNNLKSATFINEYVLPTKYIYSNFTSVGEAEKKIINYIIKKIPNEDVMIWSPDADMILLGMLLPNKNVYIILDDFRSDNLLMINIYKLKTNLYNLFKKYYQGSKKILLNDFIRDLIFLLTFFGDDFVPALESYNVNLHLLNIISAYANGIEKHGQLTTDNKINNKCYILILEKLIENDTEKIILVENYLSNYYKSYSFLRNTFNKWCITNNMNPVKFKFPILLKKCIKMYFYLYKNLDQHGGNFKDKLYKLDKKNKFIIQILYNVFLDKKGDGIDGIIFNYNKYKQLPPLNLPKSRNNFNEYIKRETRGKPFNMLSLKLQQIQNDSKFDIMLFSIEKMIDVRDKISGINWHTYFERSTTNLYQLGYVDIPDHTNNYNYNIDKYADNMINLFKKYQFKTNPIEEYLNGIMWTYYYYNSNDIGTNSWFYSYRKAPLLTDIYNFLKNGFDINQSIVNYKKNTVTDNYYTPYQQLAMITPIEDLNILPDTIIDILKKSTVYMNYLNKNYPNLQKIANKIVNYEKPNPLNCKDERYFNKCTIKKNEDIDVKLQSIIKNINFKTDKNNVSNFEEVCEL